MSGARGAGAPADIVCFNSPTAVSKTVNLFLSSLRRSASPFVTRRNSVLTLSVISSNSSLVLPTVVIKFFSTAPHGLLSVRHHRHQLGLSTLLVRLEDVQLLVQRQAHVVVDLQRFVLEGVDAVGVVVGRVHDVRPGKPVLVVLAAQVADHPGRLQQRHRTIRVGRRDVIWHASPLCPSTDAGCFTCTIDATSHGTDR